MGIASEDLERIVDAVKRGGLLQQIPCEPSDLVGDWIPLVGEPLWLEDRGQLVVGDGTVKVSELAPIGTSLSTFLSSDLAGVQAQKLWRELRGTARLYELVVKVLPAQIAPDFIAQKPANFSFLTGDDVPASSPAKVFWEKTPPAKGAFFRNFDQASNVDPDGLRFNGVSQTDAFGKHAHSLTAKSSKDLRVEVNASHWAPYPTGESKNWAIRGAGFETGARGAKETRPVNIVVLVLMRISS